LFVTTLQRISRGEVEPAKIWAQRVFQSN
jgi:hypothetical protein